jgi:hypothetical protein
MANNLFISYDLHKPEKNYAAVIKAIKSLGDWAHIHGSVWYVDSSFSAAQARDHVAKSIDKDDSLIVADTTNNDAAWIKLSEEASKFIREHWNARRAA